MDCKITKDYNPDIKVILHKGSFYLRYKKILEWREMESKDHATLWGLFNIPIEIGKLLGNKDLGWLGCVCDSVHGEFWFERFGGAFGTRKTIERAKAIVEKIPRGNYNSVGTHLAIKVNNDTMLGIINEKLFS